MEVPTPHIEANKGLIADFMLLPGDPLRAKYIADNFLRDVKQYNTVRNMCGYTGLTHDGKRVSVQGSGMGMPSLGIYVNELISGYGVKKIIRVGSCGSLREDLNANDIVIAQGSCSESNMNSRRFKGMNFAPIADWQLLSSAVKAAEELSISTRVGNILSADFFYNDVDLEEWKLWQRYGVLAVEMETAELYTIAAAKGAQALSILTVSDVIPTGVSLSSEERQTGFRDMMKIALKIL